MWLHVKSHVSGCLRLCVCVCVCVWMCVCIRRKVGVPAAYWLVPKLDWSWLRWLLGGAVWRTQSVAPHLHLWLTAVCFHLTVLPLVWGFFWQEWLRSLCLFLRLVYRFIWFRGVISVKYSNLNWGCMSWTVLSKSYRTTLYSSVLELQLLYKLNHWLIDKQEI